MTPQQLDTFIQLYTGDAQAFIKWVATDHPWSFDEYAASRRAAAATQARNPYNMDIIVQMSRTYDDDSSVYNVNGQVSKIILIKEYRALTSLGLKESKDAVEAYIADCQKGDHWSNLADDIRRTYP